MSLEFAKAHGIRIIPARVPFLLAIKGAYYSMGYAIVACATSCGENSVDHLFYVFANALHPLIIGRNLGRQYFNAGQDNSIVRDENRLLWSDMLVTEQETPKLRINDTMEITVTLDCGAGFDAISLALAQQLGFEAGHETTMKYFRIANGRTMQSRGCLDVKLESVQGNDRQTATKRTFTVVENLIFDLVLSNQFIRDEMDAQDAALLWSEVADTSSRLVAGFQDRKNLNSSSFRPLGWIKEKFGELAHKKHRDGNVLRCSHFDSMPVTTNSSNPIADQPQRKLPEPDRHTDAYNRMHARHLPPPTPHQAERSTPPQNIQAVNPGQPTPWSISQSHPSPPLPRPNLNHPGGDASITQAQEAPSTAQAPKRQNGQANTVQNGHAVH